MAGISKHVTATVPGPHGREAIWGAVRALSENFTADDVYFKINRGRGKLDTSTETVKDYLTRLVKAGVIEKVGERSRRGQFQNRIYRLVNDLGPDAPRVRKDGSFSKALGTTRMWRAMKVMVRFTAADVAFTAQVKVETAKTYCRHLKAAGYLRVLKPGTRKGLTVFRLDAAHYRGPAAPKITRLKGVYDPNIDEVVWIGHAVAREDAA
ncbi:MAG: hypothetical protein ACE5EM_01295 [Sphingomonadales bacterium]